MKVFVFTYDRFDSITTSRWLDASKIPHTVLCHTEDQRSRFIEAGRVKASAIEATRVPKGLANNRNAALDRMREGEWAVFLVDDLITVTELDDYDAHAIDGLLPITTSNSGFWAKKMRKPITARQFMNRCRQTIDFAKNLNIKLAGFAGIANSLFRRTHWHFNVLADGRAWCLQKTKLRFDTNVQMVDDVCWTAINIKHFGTMLVNQWILVDCKRYTTGAYGSITQRCEQKRRECEYMVRTYPQLLRFKTKPGWPFHTHVVLRRFTPPKIPDAIAI